MYRFHIKMLILVTKYKLIECLLSRKVSYIVCNVSVSISIRVISFILRFVLLLFINPEKTSFGNHKKTSKLATITVVIIIILILTIIIY